MCESPKTFAPHLPRGEKAETLDELVQLDPCARPRRVFLRIGLQLAHLP